MPTVGLVYYPEHGVDLSSKDSADRIQQIMEIEVVYIFAGPSLEACLLRITLSGRVFSGGVICFGYRRYDGAEDLESAAPVSETVLGEIQSDNPALRIHRNPKPKFYPGWRLTRRDLPLSSR